MEKESFEDREVADLLNQHFISIKVDREERPDVDHIYMNVCQALTGSGGWPLSIVMNPDKQPFFAGTYFPKKSRMGMMGFTEILVKLHELWVKDRDRAVASAHEIARAIAPELHSEREISADIVERTVRQLSEMFDETHGGFGRAPKFPTPQNLLFLLRVSCTAGNSKALAMVEKTLDCMGDGGIYDHVGYGFSRYSTDAFWLVPHFEKMLVDNALLAMVYAEAYQVTKKERYRTVTEEIFTYVLRDMTSPDGAFYSAEDADSEGVEGKFYVWSRQEIAQILGEADAKQFCARYGVTEKGNFEGTNILHRAQGQEDRENPDFTLACLQKLYLEREKKVHPFKDDKILTSWNGLMITALSIGGRILRNQSFIEAAEKAFSFINENLTVNGILKARWRDGEVKYDAYADDYAFLTWAAISLYEATMCEKYLQKAVELTEAFIDKFWDSESAGFFLYGSGSERLLIRPKEIYDGATPSANSVAAYNLIRLARLVGNGGYEEKAIRTLNLFAQQIERIPMGHAFSAISVWYLQSKPKDVVLLSRRDEDAREMLKVLQAQFRPNTTCLLVSEQHLDIREIAPHTKEYHQRENSCTAFVCENYACRPGVTTAAALENIL